MQAKITASMININDQLTANPVNKALLTINDTQTVGWLNTP